MTAAKLLAGVELRIAAGEFERVISTCKQTLTVSRRDREYQSEIASLIGLAQAHRYLGKVGDARILADGALDKAHQIGDSAMIVQALCETAAVRLMGSYQILSARDDYHEALRLAYQIGYAAGLARSMLGLAQTYVASGRYKQALNYGREAFAILRADESNPLVAQTLITMGCAYRGDGDTERARKSIGDALDSSRNHRYITLEGDALRAMGALYLSVQNPDDAALYLNQSLDMARRNQYLHLEFVVLESLADMHHLRGEFQDARAQYNEMLILAEQSGNFVYQAIVCLNLNKLHYAHEEYEVALDYGHQALELARQETHPLIEAEALQELGRSYTRLLRFEAAIDSFQDARAVYQALDDSAASRRLLGVILSTYVLAAYYGLLRLLGLHPGSE